MSCENCHQGEGRYENERWCEKCSQFHKKEPILTIPHEVFMKHVMNHLSLSEFVNLFEISNGMHEYMNHPDVWRAIYQRSLGAKYYPRLISLLSSSTMATVSLSPWSATDHVTILIENTTRDIPFDIYHVQADPGRPPISCRKGLGPGESYECKTFHSHRWICVPTEAWLRENQVSNVGCAFVADRDKEIGIPKAPFPSGKLWGVHQNKIMEPSVYHRIKDVDRVFSDYKVAFLRLTIDRTKLIYDIKHNQARMDNQQAELKRLHRRISSQEKEYKDAVMRETHYKKMLHIVS
jgi:hypothetical protein